MTTVEYDAIGALTSRTVVLGKAPPSIYSDAFWSGVLSDKPSSEMPSYHIDRVWRHLVNAGILKAGEA